MTLPTSEDKASSAAMPIRGFTLLELLLVITIMGLMSAVIFPKLNRVLHDKRLEEGASLLSRYIVNARAEAVHRGLSVEFVLGQEDNEFYFRIQDPTASPLGRFKRFNDNLWDAPVPLPTGVKITELTSDTAEERVQTLQFSPTGTGQEAIITLVDRRGHLARVVLGTWHEDIEVNFEKERFESPDASYADLSTASS